MNSYNSKNHTLRTLDQDNYLVSLIKTVQNMETKAPWHAFPKKQKNIKKKTASNVAYLPFSTCLLFITMAGTFQDYEAAIEIVEIYSN